MDNVTDSIENFLNKLLRYIRLEISETCAPAPRGIPDCNVHAILYTTNFEVRTGRYSTLLRRRLRQIRRFYKK